MPKIAFFYKTNVKLYIELLINELLIYLKAKERYSYWKLLVKVWKHFYIIYGKRKKKLLNFLKIILSGNLCKV